MLSSDIETPEDPCALIEGAEFGDANFYGKWLLAAAKAEALWKMIQSDKQFTILLGGDIPDLGVGAIFFLAGIKKHCCIVSLRRTDDMVEFPIMVEFVLLAALGFFTLAGDRYLMTLPAQDLDIDVLRMTASRICETEGDDYLIHPEQIITAMPRLHAEQWNERLWAMNEEQRCADRAVFLEDWAKPPISNIIW
jgi:hypothetical protein